jgi:hypothetical protein
MAAARTSNGLPEFGREKIRYQLFRWIWVLQGNEFGQTGFGFIPASGNDLSQFVWLDFQVASLPETSDANR